MSKSKLASAVKFAGCRAILLLLAHGGSSCVPVPPPPDGGSVVYNNLTDPTNRGASYIGSAACSACHSSIGQSHALHGHAHMLTPIEGEPPEYPAEATRAGVPEPPEGFDWTDISYVIGGYTKRARFVDREGYLLPTGETGVATQWNLPFPPNGSAGGFVPYEPNAMAPLPYDHSCFVCHTTGPQAQSTEFPESQENRPGIRGTWAEAGVQCEACHGPGSNHIPNPSARDLYVNSRAASCGACHSRGDPDVILAQDGFILNYQQWPELLASGSHAGFDCTTCHSPHASATYDRDNGIRNDCRDCHATTNMAFHAGRVYERGDYTEELTCVSCHMTYATRSASSAGPDVGGDAGRMGDTRTHIFRINTEAVGFETFFTDGGDAVREDELGRAALTVDFVCLRCHNGIGNAFRFSSVSAAASTARGLHLIGD